MAIAEAGAPSLSRALPSATASVRQRPGPGWVYAHLAIQFGCQLALLVPSLVSLRVFFRSAATVSPLVFLLLVRGASGRIQPVHAWGLASLLVVTLSALSPAGGSPMAVVAQWVFYIAVIAPLFWCLRLDLRENVLGRVLLVLWGFHFASSVLGVLQVYFPGRFQPALAMFVTKENVLTIRLATGEWVARPMGLSDTPGAAGPSGFVAALLGLGVVLARPFPFARLAGTASMLVGMMCVYLAQVRVALVLMIITYVVLAVLLMILGRISGLMAALLVGVGVAFASYELAATMGGDQMISRVSTLTQAPALSVYQLNRGNMLDDVLLNRVPKYPFGAGLGHWGMMCLYFGSREDIIGAEIQWAGWVLDGGVPLMIAYTGSLLTMIYMAVRATFRAPDPAQRCWMALVAAYDVGIFALCFSYAPFMGAAGIEFWFLNGVLLNASLKTARTAAWRPRPVLSIS